VTSARDRNSRLSGTGWPHPAGPGLEGDYLVAFAIEGAAHHAHAARPQSTLTNCSGVKLTSADRNRPRGVLRLLACSSIASTRSRRSRAGLGDARRTRRAGRAFGWSWLIQVTVPTTRGSPVAARGRRHPTLEGRPRRRRGRPRPGSPPERVPSRRQVTPSMSWRSVAFTVAAVVFLTQARHRRARRPRSSARCARLAAAHAPREQVEARPEEIGVPIEIGLDVARRPRELHELARLHGFSAIIRRRGAEREWSRSRRSGVSGAGPRSPAARASTPSEG
jgi:hypothetical protein